MEFKDISVTHLLFPFKTNGNPSRCFKTAYSPIRPLIWQCRKQKNLISFILDQHFQNSCCKAKIPINLKWWMGTKHVGIDSTSCQTTFFFSGKAQLFFSEVLMHDSHHQVLPTGRLSRPCTTRFLHPLFFPVPHDRHSEVLDSPWKSDFQGTGHINGKDVCGEYPFPDNHKTIPVAALLSDFQGGSFSELLYLGC